MTPLEKVKAVVISKSILECRSRFIPDPFGEHSYQGDLYDYEGVEFLIALDAESKLSYGGIKSLIIGLGLHLSRGIDVPNPDLIAEYKKCVQKLKEPAAEIKIGRSIEIIFSAEKYSSNRAIKDVRRDPCLWREDVLLYAPHGYEHIDWGDGRRTAIPEVKDVKVA